VVEEGAHQIVHHRLVVCPFRMWAERRENADEKVIGKDYHSGCNRVDGVEISTGEADEKAGRILRHSPVFVRLRRCMLSSKNRCSVQESQRVKLIETRRV